MRTKNLALPIGALLSIAGCAATSPKPQQGAVPKADELAVFQGGHITRAEWSNWKKTNRLTAATPEEEGRQFNEYLRFQLDAQAAITAGLTKDSLLNLRKASIRQRILAEHYRADVIDAQYGVDDTTVTRFLASHAQQFAGMSADSARQRAIRTLALRDVNIDSVFQARKATFGDKPLDSVRTELENSVLREKSEIRTREFPDLARKLYKVEIQTPPRPEPSEDSLKALYKAIASAQFGSPAIFHMKALGARDSASLAKALAKVQDAAAFEALSAKFPIGSPARAPKGDLGRVKKQFALPYGLGMAPALFNELEPARTGLVAPIQLADTLWAAFWVVSVDSGAVKSYESVRAEVREQFFQSHPWTPPASAVYATWDRGTMLTQADLNVLYQEIPQHMHRQYPAAKLLDFMTLWAVVARAAEETGLTQRPEVQQSIADKDDIFWAQEWRKSAEYQTFGVSIARQDSALKAWSRLFAKGAWLDTAGANRDGARLVVMPAGYLASRFAEDQDRYRKDTVFARYDSIESDLFRDLRADIDALGRTQFETAINQRYHLVLAKDAPGQQAQAPAGARLDSARKLHDRRALDQAQKLYQSVESDASAPDSLRAQSLFQLGQLYSEQQVFPAALSRYRAVLSRFPKSDEAYKARFMIAFTYSEYMKEEKVALKEYRRVLADYPKCDLADDADWMIRNIESGGALMPKFDDLDTTNATSAAPAATEAPAAKPAVEAPKAAPAAPAKPASTPVAAKAPAAKAATEAKK